MEEKEEAEEEEEEQEGQIQRRWSTGSPLPGHRRSRRRCCAC